MLASSPPVIARRRWPRWLQIVGWSVLGLLGAGLAVFIATVTFGAVHGTEFCPQTFERRSYAYYELPILQIQVTGEKHEDLTGPTEIYVTSTKLITPPASGRKDWHVLLGSRGTRQRQPGDAHILMEYLDAQDGDKHHRWARWSEDHASLAQVFWPAVQRLAAHELYLFTPDLFDLAKSTDDPALLKQQLNRLIAQKLTVVAERRLSRGDQAGATQLREEARSLDPDRLDGNQPSEPMTAEADASGKAAR